MWGKSVDSEPASSEKICRRYIINSNEKSLSGQTTVAGVVRKFKTHIYDTSFKTHFFTSANLVLADCGMDLSHVNLVGVWSSSYDFPLAGLFFFLDSLICNSEMYIYICRVACTGNRKAKITANIDYALDRYDTMILSFWLRFITRASHPFFRS